METQEKIVLTPETFDNVVKMLNSPNEENAVVALSAMEGMDFKKCKLYMALLYKVGMNKAALWKEHCPNLLKNIEGLKLDNEVTLRHMYLHLLKDASEGEKQVYFVKFQEMLRVMMKGWGFKDIVDELDIKITMKNEE